MNGAPADGGAGLRADKWLWHARFFKSRSLAQTMVGGGRLRLNSQPVTKTHQQVRPGDVLTFPQGPYVRVIQVLAIGTRRGPATEARTLYNDLAPPETAPTAPPGSDAAPGLRDRGAGRPTKKERRLTDRLRDSDSDLFGD